MSSFFYSVKLCKDVYSLLYRFLSCKKFSEVLSSGVLYICVQFVRKTSFIACCKVASVFLFEVLNVHAEVGDVGIPENIEAPASGMLTPP